MPSISIKSVKKWKIDLSEPITTKILFTIKRKYKTISKIIKNAMLKTIKRQKTTSTHKTNLKITKKRKTKRTKDIKGISNPKWNNP
jgi:hypothetical protein